MNDSQKSASSADREQGDPVALSGLLEAVFSELGINPRLEECRAKLAWKEAVGTQLARHTQPLSINNGRLEVVVSSSVWSSQLSFMKTEILERINRKAGSDVVTGLVFVTARNPGELSTGKRTIGGSVKTS